MAERERRSPWKRPSVAGPVGLLGGLAGAVEDAGGGAEVQVEGDAVVGVAGHAGDVGGVEFPGEQGGGAEDVAEAVPGPGAVAVGGAGDGGWCVLQHQWPVPWGSRQPAVW